MDIKKYFRVKQELFDEFNYQSDWINYAIEDYTDMYWVGNDSEIRFSTLKTTINDDANSYVYNIYEDRFLSKSIYLSKDNNYSMILVRAGNDRFFMIVDNAKRITNKG